MISEETISETEARPASDPLEWFELYGDYLFAYARRRVRVHAAAEDLVQETFLAALSATENFAGKSSEKTWLTGILKHKIYDYFGKNFRSGELTPEEADFSGYNQMFEREDEWDGHWNDNFAPADWGENNRRESAARSRSGRVSNRIFRLPDRTSRTHRGRFRDARSGRFNEPGDLHDAQDFDKQLLDDDAPRTTSSAAMPRNQLVLRSKK